MRRIQYHKNPGKGNSLLYWHKAKNPLTVVLNFLLIHTAKYVPSLRLKRILYRTTGMKVGRDVAIGLEVTADVFFPELMNVGSNTIIGFGTTILCHEFLKDEWRTGEVIIGKDVTIGANCTILPGVKIDDGAVISAMSLVNKDVKAGAFVGGIPIRPLKKRDTKRRR